MGYDNLRKRTDEFVKDKESYDYEFEDFSQESEKLNNAKGDFLKLDSDVISAFGEVESEFDASAEILDKEKEKPPFIEYKGERINIVDTPGHADF